MFGVIVVLGACPSAKDPRPEPESARDGAHEPESAQDGALRLLARANTFAATPGKDARGDVDWPSVALATGLASVQAFDKLSEEELGLVGGRDALVMKASEALAEADYEAEGKRAADAYANSWKGAQGCTSVAKSDPLLDKIPAAIESSLSPAATKRLAAIRAGKAFDVTCTGFKGRVVLSKAGKVLAMDEMRPTDHDDLRLDAAEDRFVNYMNAPDEPE